MQSVQNECSGKTAISLHVKRLPSLGRFFFPPFLVASPSPPSKVHLSPSLPPPSRPLSQNYESLPSSLPPLLLFFPSPPPCLSPSLSHTSLAWYIIHTAGLSRIAAAVPRKSLPPVSESALESPTPQQHQQQKQQYGKMMHSHRTIRASHYSGELAKSKKKEKRGGDFEPKRKASDWRCSSTTKLDIFPITIARLINRC